MISAKSLIAKRIEKWNQDLDYNSKIEYDKRFRNAVANELVSNKSFLNEVRKNPEYLIELLFVVVNKEQKTVPFFMNAVQAEFIEILNKAIRDYEKGKIAEVSILILKGRQQGFTTLITAYQLACSILNKNFQGYTLADKVDNAETIFQNKAKFTYSQLPYILKPTEKFSNKKQFLFDKINSSWSVDSATKDVGRSRTVNFFHGSECAFWKDGIAPIQAALGEAFTKNCIKIYESTANGYNDYETMWTSKAHINCFFEWWKTPEYFIDLPSKDEEDKFIKDIDTKDEWIYTRLKWLKDVIKLKTNQLYWYFKKYEGYIDKRLIKQEYPCSPEEAFLLSGENVFDTDKIMSRLKNLPKVLHIGYFEYKYDGLKISEIKWREDKNGFIRLYESPSKIKKYAMGGDTAGDGSDFYTAHVLDAETGNQVATLKRDLDPDIYTKQIYCLGKFYNDALIAVEANFDTHPIAELQRLKYPKQYVREYFDTYTGKKEKRFGFKTTSITRPAIISKLIEIVREHIELINDEDTLTELAKITRNDKGRVEAPAGKHDDQMMGLAIAHHCMEQVVFDKNVIRVKPKDDFDFFDKKTDYEDDLKVF